MYNSIIMPPLTEKHIRGMLDKTEPSTATYVRTAVDDSHPEKGQVVYYGSRDISPTGIVNEMRRNGIHGNVLDNGRIRTRHKRKHIVFTGLHQNSGNDFSAKEETARLVQNDITDPSIKTITA